MIIEKRGQIWVETVIYTLIGVTLLGLVLAFAIPSIEKQKDQKIVEESINAMIHLDNLIEEVRDLGPGNQRKISLMIKKGRLVFNPIGKNISFEIEKSAYEASEASRTREVFVDISGTNLKIKTMEKGKDYSVQIVREFEDIELLFNGEDTSINELTAAANPYRLIVENQGRETSGGLLKINIKEVS
jgi:type II secretory pathway pseudopilin PulG